MIKTTALAALAVGIFAISISGQTGAAPAAVGDASCDRARIDELHLATNSLTEAEARLHLAKAEAYTQLRDAWEAC